MIAAAGVVGGGTMGTGIAYVLAVAGTTTVVVEPDDERATRLIKAVTEAAAGAIRRGKLDAAAAEAMLGRIERVSAVQQLPQALDLIVETVPERLALKHEVLAAAEVRRPTVLATNTSALSIDALASALANPANFLGMHFFNPVWALPLVELVRGTATGDETVRMAERIVEAVGKQSVIVRDVPGFATSRLDLVAALEAMRMLESGVASAEDIDRAVVLAYRHPVGPLRLSDIVGLDVRLDIARTLEQTYGERFAPPRLLIEKVEAGQLGRKTGRGFFDWS